MKQLGEFSLSLDRTRRKQIPVEVLVDNENTMVLLDCGCCEDLLANKLPGGILIPIASAMKIFFESMGMRNVNVRVNGIVMRRTYKGVISEEMVPELESILYEAVAKFSKKRRR
ncbi:MAG: hypothetical protein EAX95_05745 [Candidatus Thorarchaeota archaeon]|nr:hypothetical protein [Candidatus Thorarchaeota archaeon]